VKLFIREQLPLIFIYLTQLFIILLVFWVDGYQSISISLYAVLLSICLFTGYLVFRYFSHRAFYKRLEKPLVSLEETLMEETSSPLAEGLHQLLKSQHRQYQSEIHSFQHKLHDHIQFINQWVHQMKTPLSVIHLMIQNEDDPRFTSIGDELDRIKKGLEMVLYSARLDSFEHDFYVETLNLKNVIRSITSEQKRLFIRNRIFPSIQLDDNLTIASDEKWLSFALSQIITNAIRYTVEENRKIYFLGKKHENNIVLEIKDEGVGISKSDLPRVLDPYFTGENGRVFQESTGMGLYLVKQICDKLGHQVEIESTVNDGTTVRIIF
jgi:two-component system, OmpR family, sensor histidine kinase YxdK